MIQNTCSVSNAFIITPAQQNLVLSCFTPGSRILGAEPMQAMQPCPLRVYVLDPHCDVPQQVVLRLSRNRGGVEREAAVLPCLLDNALPVPRLIGGPVSDADGESFSVLEFLPGFTLQVLADASDVDAFRAKNLLVDGITRLFAATTAVSQSSAAHLLPRCSLHDAWIVERDAAGGWEEVPWYQEALSLLEPLCLQAASATPLFFSNGDYQPGNFLTDGETITGYLDFEKVGFEDPLWTLARYPVYKLEPFDRTGLAQAVLDRLGFTGQQFAVRVALFGLRTLRTKTNLDGTRNGALQERVQELVKRSLQQAER